MNLRQKAKRFKRLYEEGLPKKPYPVVYQTTIPKHYRAQLLIDMKDVEYLRDNPQLLRIQIENRMLEELRPVIRDNIKVRAEPDRYPDKTLYTVDMWMETEKGGLKDDR